MTDRSQTETQLGAPRVSSRDVPYLFVVLEAARPLAGSARLSLDALTELAIGRGEQRAVTSDGSTARLELPDRRLSSVHATKSSHPKSVSSWQPSTASHVSTPVQKAPSSQFASLGSNAQAFALSSQLSSVHATPSLHTIALPG